MFIIFSKGGYFMHKFATGLIAGGILGAVGLGMAMSDKRTRRQMTKDTKKMIDKANDMLHKLD